MTEPAAELLLFKNQVTLECKNIFYKPKSKKISFDILNDVSAKFESGRLIAVLGPSGAGKTSLLNILSGFKNNGLRGRILVNGTERKRSEFRKISSYIPQQFAMLDKLTVIETLNVSADLKLGLKTKHCMKEKVVNEIIRLLNLEKSTDTLVGRLSGGERKRLSIGIELVTNPPIMLFDEPTSGLDSVSSLQVLCHLQKLAHFGRTVICVIHQPSSRLLKLFDDVLVLSDGECIYNGTEENMISAFANQGFICPKYYNAADYVIEVASKEHGSNLSSLISANNLKYGEDPNLYEVKTVDSTSNIITGLTSPNISNGAEVNDHVPVYPVTFYEQFMIITKRSMLVIVRDKLCVQLRVIVHVLIACLLGVVFWDVGDDASKIFSNNSCLFFIVMFIFFANAMPTVLSCPLETEVFLREHLNNWYSTRAYYLAKFASDLPLQFLCPTLFTIIAYYLTGQPDDLQRFLMFGLMCLLTAVVGQSFGLVAGSTFNMNLAVFIVPASSIPMLIFSGFFIRFNDLAEFLLPVTYLSYFRYSFEGSIQAIYGYNRSDLACTASFCYYKSTAKFLEDINMNGDRYGNDVLALVIWTIVFQISLYISLVVKVKRAQ